MAASFPYDATFLVFSDYARNAVRMSALIPAHAIHVYTHDSIGLGEDGPTHQPVEHLASAALHPEQPGLASVRCGGVGGGVEGGHRAQGRAVLPGVLAPDPQASAAQRASRSRQIARGGYVLSDPADTKFQAILIATGSEVGLAMEAARALAQQDVPVRVVSMPCAEVFDAQPLEYREGVLPGWCRARVAVEAATADFWRKYVGLDGEVVGMTTFGASAPAPQLFEHFGFTVSHVVDAVKRVVG